MGKIGPFVGKDETIGPFVIIGPVAGIGLFGGTGPVVSLTYILVLTLDGISVNDFIFGSQL